MENCWTETKYNANVYGTKLLNNIIEAKFLSQIFICGNGLRKGSYTR